MEFNKIGILSLYSLKMFSGVRLNKMFTYKIKKIYWKPVFIKKSLYKICNIFQNPFFTRSTSSNLPNQRNHHHHNLLLLSERSARVPPPFRPKSTRAPPAYHTHTHTHHLELSFIVQTTTINDAPTVCIALNTPKKKPLQQKSKTVTRRR